MNKILITIFLGLICSNTFSITIGAKKFTEGNIMAYILAQTIKDNFPNQEISILENLGGTGIVTTALQNGEIDLYVDYTGTLVQTFNTSYEALSSTLDEQGLTLGPLLGFNNSYELAVLKDSPLSKVSDIKDERIGLSHEFFKRRDGWDQLKRHYQLQLIPKVIEHALLYDSINSGQLDVIEVYTTDAKIEKYDYKVLKDDKSFFPKYDAVIVFNKNFVKKHPKVINLLEDKLTGNISNKDVTVANYSVEVEGRDYQEGAALITKSETIFKGNEKDQILPYFIEHIEYLVVTVLLCILIGVPIGIFTTKNKLAQNIFLSLISILQTIPSLALLVFLIPLFGLGKVTTVIALVTYGLLPIVKNTHEGIKQIPRELIEYSDLIGMSKWQKIFMAEIPLAMQLIISGVKLTSIYTIGITVIAAFIGAGGLGTLIVTGLSLNNNGLILKGAVPSALLAIIVELLFEKVIPLLYSKRIQS